MKGSSILKFNDNQCCICGCLTCIESNDHETILLPELINIISSNKKNEYKVQNLKIQLNNFYHTMENYIIKLIRQEHQRSQSWLNQFYFLNKNNSKINIPFISNILQGSINGLPQKRLSKWLKYLNKQPNSPEDMLYNDELEYIQQTTYSFISNYNWNMLQQKINSMFFSNFVNFQKIPQLMPKKTMIFQHIPEDIGQLQIYKWKNATLKPNSKTLNLSNKEIKDIDLIIQMPIISHYKSLTELQLRYNLLSQLSCKLISNNLNYLKSLDIRGNRDISDQGIIHVIHNVQNLKSFMISETGATDQTAKQLVNGLSFLQVLWCQNNNLTDKYALKIILKPKLKAVCLSGNRISENQIQRLKRCFDTKGYLVV